MKVINNIEPMAVALIVIGEFFFLMSIYIKMPEPDLVEIEEFDKKTIDDFGIEKKGRV